MTPEVAYHYAVGLGATPTEAPAAAQSLMTGGASILSEVIVNGEVRRSSARPGEAYNTVLQPRDPEDPNVSTIPSLDRYIDRLNREAPDDPALPMLTRLRERMLMLEALQPPLTETGIGPAPGTGGGTP